MSGWHSSSRGVFVRPGGAGICAGRGRRVLAGFVLGLILLAAATGEARVFWRRRINARNIVRTMPGWQAVYTGRVNINGQPGDLQVWLCDDRLSTALAALRGAWEDSGVSVEFSTGAGMLTGLARDGDRVTRMLLLYLPETDQTVVFNLEQSAEDYRRTQAGPAGARLEVLPAYPGSQAQLLVENEDTRSGLEFSRAHAPPAAVRDFYHQALDERGYRPLLPAVDGNFMLFQSRDMLGCILLHADAPGETTITVLHKRRQIE